MSDRDGSGSVPSGDVRRVLHDVNNKLLVAATRVELARGALSADAQAADDLDAASEALREVVRLLGALHAQARAVRAVEPATPPPLAKGAGQAVWVIDDQPMVANVLARQITRLGYTARAFTDDGDAVAALAAGPPAVVLLDYRLAGGRSGSVLAQRLVEAVPGLPVVLMSGQPLPPAVASAPHVWPEWLRKPFDHATLGRVLARAAKPAVPDD